MNKLDSILLAAFCFLFSVTCYPQGIAINSLGSGSNASAILDVSGNNQGILFPRVTDAQRDAIISPASGLLIFNTTTNNYNICTGSGWYEITSTFVSASSGLTSPGGGLAVNSTGASPDNSAQLDVSSTTKGVLLPRTTTAAIPTVVTGLIIYNNSVNNISYYNGSSWISPCLQFITAATGTGTPTLKGIAINTTGALPNASAMLDVSSTTKGVLFPRLTSAERNSLLPVTGLTIYNSDTNNIEYWNGTGWYSIAPAGNGFITEWRTTGINETITLPLNNGNGSAFNCTVYWGDGTSSTITSSTDIDRIHTYATANDYQVEIIGTCEGWSFNYGGDRLKVRKVISWGTQCGFSGFKYLNSGFAGCANLSSIAAGGILASGTGCTVRGFESEFGSCTSLTSIPADLFKYHTSVSNFGFLYAFDGCTSITSIPAHLFDYNTALSEARFAGTFRGCTSLNSVPANLFDYNTAVYAHGFGGTFNGCTSLTSIPPRLFDYNTAVSTQGFYYTFHNCTSLTSIPANLFDYNTAVSWNAFYQTFQGCTSLTSIPANLFDFNTAVGSQGFYQTFYGCISLSSIPSDLFKFNTLVTVNGFYGTFYNCTSLTSIPANLFDFNTAVSTSGFNQTFYGCTSLTSIPANLFDYNTIVSSSGFYYTFGGCTSLTSIPSDLFKYNTAVSTFGFYGTFQSCNSLTSIPTDLFRYNTLVSTSGFAYTFYGCTSLILIPANLFDYNILVSTSGFDHTFSGCNLLASIPSDLFKYNTAVSSSGFYGTFQSCASLTSIPADLFKYNTAVSATGFANTFYGCNSLTSIPTDLFRYNTAVSTWGFSTTFFGCTSLTTVPADLFRYNTAVSTGGFTQTFMACTKLKLNRNIFFADGEETTRFLNQSVDFTNCFSRGSFSGLQGEAPPLWNCDFGTGTPVKTTCFGGAGNSAASLSNYASIPAVWK